MGIKFLFTHALSPRRALQVTHCLAPRRAPPTGRGLVMYASMRWRLLGGRVGAAARPPPRPRLAAGAWRGPAIPEVFPERV